MTRIRFEKTGQTPEGEPLYRLLIDGRCERESIPLGVILPAISRMEEQKLARPAAEEEAGRGCSD